MLEINRPDTNGPRRSRNTGTVCKLNWLGPGPLTALCWHSVARSTTALCWHSVANISYFTSDKGGGK